MTTINQQLVAKLADVSRSLSQIVEQLQGPQPQVSEEVRARVRELLGKGLCLNGGHEVRHGEAMIRGMCRMHYNQANAAKKAGKITEAELIAEGLWTEEGQPGGRKAKSGGDPLSQLLLGKHETSLKAMSSEELDAEIMRTVLEMSAKDREKAVKSGLLTQEQLDRAITGRPDTENVKGNLKKLKDRKVSKGS